MIDIDHYVVGFITTNPYTIMLFLALLKGIAKLTPGTTDDKVATLLSNMFGMFKRAQKKNGEKKAGEGQ